MMDTKNLMNEFTRNFVTLTLIATNMADYFDLDNNSQNYPGYMTPEFDPVKEAISLSHTSKGGQHLLGTMIA